jgi:glycerophosphoryl diester phosphodiesterase
VSGGYACRQTWVMRMTDPGAARAHLATATSSVRATRGVICYAHRGARAHAPENTLLAFKVAFDLGADAIECDVRLSRDGRLVIMHDDTVDRTTDGTGPVADQSYTELRGLDAGARWRLPQRIPTLEETLALVRERGGGVNLEVKGESGAASIATAQELAVVLRELGEGLREQVLVSSFEHPAVALLKEELPWVRVAALFSDEWRRRDIIGPARLLGAEAIHPSVKLVSEDVVRRAHESGLRINVWTANSWGTIRQLIAWGVDGLFSDCPERVIIARATMESDFAKSEMPPA